MGLCIRVFLCVCLYGSLPFNIKRENKLRAMLNGYDLNTKPIYRTQYVYHKRNEKNKKKVECVTPLKIVHFDCSSILIIIQAKMFQAYFCFVRYLDFMFFFVHFASFILFYR